MNLLDTIADAIDRWPGDHIVTAAQAAALAAHVADAIAEATGPEHIVKSDSRGGWTIQHPIAERFDGTLFACPITQLARPAAEAGAFGLDRTHTLSLDRGVLIWEETE